MRFLVLTLALASFKIIDHNSMLARRERDATDSLFGTVFSVIVDDHTIVYPHGAIIC